MFTFIAPFYPRYPFLKLIQDVLLGKPSTWAKTPIVTKGTTANRDRSVHIGASKSSVYADTLYPIAKKLLQIIAITELPQTIGFPVHYLRIMRGVFS